VVITDIKNQDMRIYFCLDREAVQIQGPGLFVFGVFWDEEGVSTESRSE
jgi:hypothetical protein